MTVCEELYYCDNIGEIRRNRREFGEGKGIILEPMLLCYKITTIIIIKMHLKKKLTFIIMTRSWKSVSETIKETIIVINTRKKQNKQLGSSTLTILRNLLQIT